MKSLLSSSGNLNTIISPRWGSENRIRIVSQYGSLKSYRNFVTRMWSPIVRVGTIEPEGILKAWTMKVRMNRARMIAMRIASPYSRQRGLLRTDSVRSPPAGDPVIGAGSIDGTTTPSLSAEPRSEEHTSELQSPYDLVCRLLLEK